MSSVRIQPTDAGISCSKSAPAGTSKMADRPTGQVLPSVRQQQASTDRQVKGFWRSLPFKRARLVPRAAAAAAPAAAAATTWH